MIEAFDRRPESGQMLFLPARGDGRHGAAMKGAMAADDAIALRIAEIVLVFAQHLQAAFDGLGAGVGEEDAVGEAVGDQALGQARLRGNLEQVRGMPELVRLLGQGRHQMGMGVAQRGHRNARGEVEIARAVAGIEIGALAAFEGDIGAGIGGHNRRDHGRFSAKKGGDYRYSPRLCQRAGLGHSRRRPPQAFSRQPRRKRR